LRLKPAIRSTTGLDVGLLDETVFGGLVELDCGLCENIHKGVAGAGAGS
jgi:hypothetical protein